MASRYLHVLVKTQLAACSTALRRPPPRVYASCTESLPQIANEIRFNSSKAQPNRVTLRNESAHKWTNAIVDDIINRLISSMTIGPTALTDLVNGPNWRP